MNPEIMMLKGQLVEANKKLHNANMEAHAVVLSLRQMINPFIDASSLKTEEISAAAKRLHSLVCEMKELRKSISEMEDGLG